MNADQADHERHVVIEFCHAASLPLEEQSIWLPGPPEPDVLCALDANTHTLSLAAC